jgi:hypothetical protein
VKEGRKRVYETYIKKGRREGRQAGRQEERKAKAIMTAVRRKDGQGRRVKGGQPHTRARFQNL